MKRSWRTSIRPPGAPPPSLSHVLEASGRADPEVLAFHFQMAGDAGTAGEYYAAAAAGAAGTLAFDRARSCTKLPSSSCRQITPTGLDYGLTLPMPSPTPGEATRPPGSTWRRPRWLTSVPSTSAQRRDAVTDQRAHRPGARRVRRRAPCRRDGSSNDPGIDRLGALSPSICSPRGALVPAARTRRSPIDDIKRADVCWTAAAGLGLVDYIRGADFSVRHLFLSLRAGEPRRVAKALAWEAANSSCGGPAQRPRRALFVQAEALAGN